MSAGNLTFIDRVELVRCYSPDHNALWRINPSIYGTPEDGDLVVGDKGDREDAMETYGLATKMDETDHFNESVADRVKDGESDDAAYEAEVGSDSSWIFLNGATPVSTADWQVHEASASECAFAGAVTAAWYAHYHDDEASLADVRGIPIEGVDALLRWFFDREPLSPAATRTEEQRREDLAAHIKHEGLSPNDISLLCRIGQELANG